MTDPEIINTLGNAIGGGAVGGALLLIVYRITSKIVDRMIAAIDRLVLRIEEHTKTDAGHHASVRESVVRLDAKIDEILDSRERTPASTPTPSRPIRVDETPSERRRHVRVPPTRKPDDE